MAREVTNHGQPGYRRGCRCEVCRKGHRESVAAWRAKGKQPKAETPTVPLEPLAAPPALNPDAPAGVIELALRQDLAALVGEPPWKGTLSALAVFNARLLDQLPTLDRLDLVSPVQLRTLEVLQRLRAVSGGAGAAEGAAAFLADLGNAD
ncbi:MAG: hypothetical protein ACYC1Z_03445 [Georgenia sp.]